MQQSEFEQFSELMETLARFWQRPSPESAAVADYFRQLKVFSLSVVTEAIDRSPDAYPAPFLPAVGQLRVLCEQIVAEQNYGSEERKTQGEIMRMYSCGHHWQWEPEPDGSFFLGFDVCVLCGLAKPKISSNPKHSKAAAYLATALSAKAGR